MILNKLVSVRWWRRLAKPGLTQISGEKTTGVAYSVLHLHVIVDPFDSGPIVNIDGIQLHLCVLQLVFGPPTPPQASP